MPKPETIASSSDVTINMMAICFGLTSAFVVQTMLLVTIPLYALELGASPLLVGVILCVPYLLPLAFAIPLGGIITRLGCRSVIIVGACGMVAGPSAPLILSGLKGLIVAQIIVGIAHIVMILAAQSAISSMGHGKFLERCFGWYTTCLSGGQLVGPLLAGWLIDSSGARRAFLVMAIIAIIGVLSSFFLTGSTRTGQATEKSIVGYRAQARLLKTNPSVKISIVLTVAVMFALGAHASFLPVYLESFSVSATTIGALLSLRALCATAIRPFMSSVIESMGGRSAAMVWSSVVVAIGLIFTGLTGNIYLLGVMAVLIGLGSGISQPLSMVVLAEHVSAAQRPSALGMRLMGNRGVQFLAPLTLGLLTEFVSFSFAFLIAGACVLAFVSVIVYLIPDFERQEAGALTD